MTIYSGPTQPTVLGQPISGDFGKQAGGAIPAGAPIIPVPLAASIGGTNLTTLEAASRGMVPMNALVSTVNGVSVGGAPTVIGSDPATVLQVLNGNGQETCRGVNTNGVNGALNQQVFVDGIGSTNAGLSTGPAPTDTSSLVEAPVAASTLLANIALYPQQYGG
jgi:hypothetical protein